MISNWELSDPLCDSKNRGLTLVRLKELKLSLKITLASKLHLHVQYAGTRKVQKGIVHICDVALLLPIIYFNGDICTCELSQ